MRSSSPRSTRTPHCDWAQAYDSPPLGATRAQGWEGMSLGVRGGGGNRHGPAMLLPPLLLVRMLGEARSSEAIPLPGPRVPMCSVLRWLVAGPCLGAQRSLPSAGSPGPAWAVRASRDPNQGSSSSGGTGEGGEAPSLSTSVVDAVVEGVDAAVEGVSLMGEISGTAREEAQSGQLVDYDTALKTVAFWVCARPTPAPVPPATLRPCLPVRWRCACACSCACGCGVCRVEP